MSAGVYVTYGIVRSYGWPVVNSFDIVSDKINTPKRICVIGDLHSKNFSTLAVQIDEQEPDLVLMAGDIFDASDTVLTPTFSLIERISKKYPVYYAIGNHERSLIETNKSFLNKLRELGVSIVDKTYYDVFDDLRIGGLYDYPFGWDAGGYNTADSAPEDVQDYLNDFVITERYTLFAAHRPESFYYSDASEVYPIDLVISAHIHGGQVVIPFKGGLYGGDQGWWPKFYHGYYEKNNISWIITSGLSTSKKKLPRFNNPPEIVIVNLLPG